MTTIRTFTKTKYPVVLLYGIKNPIAQQIIKVFLEEESKVIVVDDLNSATKTLIKPYKTNPNFMFANVNSIGKYLDSFLRLDYIYIFLDQLILGSDYPNLFKTKFNYINLTHKDFILLSNITDSLIKQGIEYASKLTITLPVDTGILISKQSQYNLKLLTYTRDLFYDLYNRTPFNGRIAYVPLNIGIQFDYSVASLSNFLLRQVVNSNIIHVPGDGLIKMNLANIQDISKALLLAGFSAKAIGQEVLIQSETITLLNFLYNSLELTANERKIKFTELTPEIQENIQIAGKYKPIKAISSIDLGYKNQYSIKQSILESLKTTSSILKASWQSAKIKNKQKIDTIVVSTDKTKDLVPKFGEKYKSFDSPVEKAFWYALWMLFNIFIKTPIDYIYSLLAEQDSIARKQILSLVVTITLAYGLAFAFTPYIILLNSLQSLKKTTQIETIQERLADIENNIYNISYLNKLGLQDQFTYLKQITKTYQEAIHKLQASQNLYNNFKTFVQHSITSKALDDNETILKDIKANPYAINNILDQLKIYNGQLEQLTPKFNTILEKNLLAEKPLLQAQMKLQISTLSAIQRIYPHIPEITGYKQELDYNMILIDTTKPNFLGGYPLGIIKLKFKNGSLINFSYYSLNKSYRDALSKSHSKKEALKILKPILSAKTKQSTIIGTVDSNMLRDLVNSEQGIYIPEYGTMKSENIADTINKFASFTKLPFTEEELVKTIFNKFKEQTSSTIISQLQQILQNKNKYIHIIKAPINLQSTFKALNILMNPTQSNALTLNIYDQIRQLDTSYTFITKKVDIVIDNNQRKITITCTYSPKNELKQDLSILSVYEIYGRISKLNTAQTSSINLPIITQNIKIIPGQDTITFIQFSYAKEKDIIINNNLPNQKIFLHITNPTPEQIKLIKSINDSPTIKNHTYIIEVLQSVVDLPLF